MHEIFIEIIQKYVMKYLNIGTVVHLAIYTPVLYSMYIEGKEETKAEPDPN